MNDTDSFRRSCDKIFAHLFSEGIKNHMSLPRFSFIGSPCRMDTIPWLNARLNGMVRISKRKYGVYNKAFDDPSCRMHKKCFPWWHA